MKKKETEHKRALKEEQSEVIRLKRELDRVEKEKTELKKERNTLKAALEKRAAGDQKIQAHISECEAKATKAEGELDAFKANAAKWLAELTKLNAEMDSKFPESYLFSFFLCIFLIRIFVSVSHLIRRQPTCSQNTLSTAKLLQPTL